MFSEVVTLNDLNLGGTFPSLTKTTVLRFLDVSYNKFSGPIDNTNWGNKPYLQYVDFSSNKFSGTIPSSFGNANSLILAYFDTNDFTGSMPQQICDLKQWNLKNLTSVCDLHNPELTCSFQDCCTDFF